MGPSYKKLRLWLSRVTCILTDCGAARKIPDMRDILPEFLDAIGVKYPMGCRMEYLFPNALPAIGWHHVLDDVLQWGLSTLDFFPLLLKKLRHGANSSGISSVASPMPWLRQVISQHLAGF